jgi:serine phosphatase RsbU (regulator of sigma subunit)
VGRAAAELDGRLGELGAFATLFHGRLDGGTGILDYVDAGHGLTLVVSASGKSERLASRDMPLGVQSPGQGFAPGRVQLQPGDTLLSVTDGALDLYDSTLGALLSIAEELRTRPDVDGFFDGMAARVAVTEVDDDVTVLVVTFG